MNNKNLKSNYDRTPQERRELARKAGKASGKARGANKLMKAILIELSQKKEGKQTVKEIIYAQLIKSAKKGDLKAIEMFTTYIGEKPIEKQEIQGKMEIANDLSKLSDETLLKMAREAKIGIDDNES
ncbi:MAG: hypothetical protein LBT79_00835 [Elusimicrobiota bacterium]|jgi:hypothetical protein|nr:hypothetical protein [Elusimicrobiota bacterium]